MDAGPHLFIPQIQNNNINTVFGAVPFDRIGININYGNKYYLIDNTIDLAYNDKDVVGIRATGCKDLRVSCNNITGSGNYSASVSAKNQAGIHFFNTGFPNEIGCNDVDKTYNGILFNGVARGQLELRGNNFREHVFGLHVTTNAAIGDQDFKGNMWHQANINPTGIAGLNAWNENPNTLFQKIRVNPNDDPTGFMLPTFLTQQPNNWVLPDTTAGPNEDCEVGGVAVYCNQFNPALLATFAMMTMMYLRIE